MKTNENQKIFPRLKNRIFSLAHRLAIVGAIVGMLGITYCPPVSHLESGTSSGIPQSRKSTSAKVGWSNKLGGSKTGRVVLHTMCLFRHPERASWHWHGIMREFAA